MAPLANFRLATADDWPAILKLRNSVGHLNIPSAVDGSEWQANAADFFADNIESDRLQAIVATPNDQPDEIIACGIAVIFEMMPAEWLPNGQVGYLQWFATAANWQRRGLATEIAKRLIDWLRLKGVQRAQLHSTAEGMKLYTDLAFEPTLFPNLWTLID